MTHEFDSFAETLVARTNLRAGTSARRPLIAAEMLDAIGAASMDELIEQTVPSAIRQSTPLDLGPALSEPRGAAKAARGRRQEQA